MMKYTVTAFLLMTLAIKISQAQDTTHTGKLTISGYAELYYSQDFNHPANHNRPPFVYSYNRTNEVDLNLGFIKAAYSNDFMRANLAFMAGTYTNANLAPESGVLKNIYEANAGVKLSKKTNLWLDAGVFSSHIGYESAVGKDCWVLTRNIVSDNTPYYEAGARLTYNTPDGKFTAVLLYLNGWQRMQRENGNNTAAGGLQLTWKVADFLTLNYSNYLGSQGADSVGVRRFYNDFYAMMQISKKFGLIAGLDYGTQRKSHSNNNTNYVLAPSLIARYSFTDQWALAGRVEYYKDPGGIFIPVTSLNGFSTYGYSVNVDYIPYHNVVLRLEGKTYSSPDKIFLKGNAPVNDSPLVTAAIAVSF
jgi:hypothetical protein